VWGFYLGSDIDSLAPITNSDTAIGAAIRLYRAWRPIIGGDSQALLNNLYFAIAYQNRHHNRAG
jgi:hypothetical protein